MHRFAFLILFCTLDCLLVVYGARLPEVQGSKGEEKVSKSYIKSRNPRVVLGVSIACM